LSHGITRTLLLAMHPTRLDQLPTLKRWMAGYYTNMFTCPQAVIFTYWSYPPTTWCC